MLSSVDIHDVSNKVINQLILSANLSPDDIGSEGIRIRTYDTYVSVSIQTGDMTVTYYSVHSDKGRK